MKVYSFSTAETREGKINNKDFSHSSNTGSFFIKFKSFGQKDKFSLRFLESHVVITVRAQGIELPNKRARRKK